MKRNWTDAELTESWSLGADELGLSWGKPDAKKLGCAILLKFFQLEGRFPRHPLEIPAQVVEYVAQQVHVPSAEWARYEWNGRSIKRHRAEIRTLLGFREATTEDGEALTAWLSENCDEQDPDRFKTAACDRCRVLRIEPPAWERLDRLVRSAMQARETRCATTILEQLSPETRHRLDGLISELSLLRSDPGRGSLATIGEEVAKLDRVRSLGIPPPLFLSVPASFVRACRQRVAVEEPFELRRHPEALRMALLAAFCHQRGQELTDTLVDLLIESIHKIASKAERKVTRELIEDLKRVSGKDGLLFRIAEASLAEPDGVVKDVVYPIVGEQTLRELVREAKSSGQAFRKKLQVVMRGSYRSHYRRMVPKLLRALEFRSNNESHRPVIQALQLLHRYLDSKARLYPIDEDVPLDGVARAAWRETISEKDGKGRTRIKRIDYEICVLEMLREKLRCKEIWVVGADRYRNPDEDLPQDFDLRRETYYAELKVPLGAQAFVDQVRQELADELAALDKELPSNPQVEISTNRGGWIKLSPLVAQPEPLNLAALKREIMERWSTTSLLDILKEADLRIGFTDVFRSATARENMDRDVLRPRLLLCLFGLGTNTGLKRVVAGQEDITYKDLLYVRRRFITSAHLREVIRQVVNAIFEVRQGAIWGEATTACASDSKKFGAWDQNLMTEWHARYRGPGVMIYWHVERKSACVFSQLKTCSSSETASMIQGVLRHCTSMQIEKNYVDSHGQSEVAFAFCRFLGFKLLPRLKPIHKQKLYRPESGKPDAYPNLQPVLTRPIDWNLIAQQYDEMIKFSTALRLGTADAESILRRFTRANVQHPTYKALAELGKADRTIFLCRYLRILALRREIEEGLNVVENWNSANGFICYGRGGEMASNNRDDQESTMLCLHLLQICLVYINTLMIQQVLVAPTWLQRMLPEDLRGLTPLIYSHVTPYGSFRLDMSSRLRIDGTEERIAAASAAGWS